MRDVSDLTGFPEMMDGRVKTLHPAVHGGLLGIRANPEHQAAMLAHGIPPIDLLVVNLYPFEATVAAGKPYDDCIENIDIGGPAMIRAAAKNHARRGGGGGRRPITRPFSTTWRAMTAPSRCTLRRRLAQKAYARTAAYDAAISNWFADRARQPDAALPRARRRASPKCCATAKIRTRRAAFYRTPEQRPGVATARQVQGKQLSYNNINDTDAAYEAVAEFDPARSAAIVIVKHANPCGVAEGATLRDAYEKALRCDPVSAFGGIVAHEPHARCGGRQGHRRDLHRGDHRARRHRGGHRHRRREEEPAPAARRRPARSRARAA